MNKTITNNDVFLPNELLYKGTLFKDLYKNYKGIDGMYKATTPKEKTMVEMQKYLIGLIDLNLYLDVHPEDTSAIKLYNEYLKHYKEEKEKYEKLYKPLCLTSNNLTSTPWAWVSPNWPWMVNK